MSLSASSKSTNAAKSVYDYLGDKLEAQSLVVDYEGLDQDLSEEDEFVQLRLLDAGRKYAGQAEASGQRGNWVQCQLNVIVFVKQATQTNAYRPREIRDIVVEEFPIGLTFDLTDFDAEPPEAAGLIKVFSLVNDRRLADAEGYYQHNLVFLLAWLETY